MKKMILLTSVLLVFFGCAFGAEEVLLQSVTNNVGVGEKIVVKLEENGSTGFVWNYTISNPDILKLVDENVINPNQGKPGQEQMSGAPYFKEWTFEVADAGDAVVIFSYYRPWEDPKTAIDFKVFNLKSFDSAHLQEGNNTLSVNEVGKIELEENPSTGYAWTYEVEDPDGNLVIDKKVIKGNSNSSDNPNEIILGAPNNVVYELSAKKSGTYKVTFSYGRSWEDAPATSLVYELEVVDAISIEESLTEIDKDQLAYTELYENATTGYTWNFEISNKKVLQFYKKEIIKNVNSGTIGAGNEIKLSFEPVLEGKTMLSIRYYRSWEGPEKPVNPDFMNNNLFFIVSVK